MLEILIIILVGKKVGGIAEDKGYGGILFTLLFVGCWFAGEVLGFILGFAFLKSMGAAYGLALLLAILGGFFAFVVASMLPDAREERFDSLGQHRILKKRRKRRPRPIQDEDDSYRERARPRRRQPEEVEVDELEIIEDDEVDVLEEVEEPKPPPKKTPPQPQVRKPAANTDPTRIKKPDQKVPPRPPLRKPNSGRDGIRPSER